MPKPPHKYLSTWGTWKTQIRLRGCNGGLELNPRRDLPILRTRCKPCGTPLICTVSTLTVPMLTFKRTSPICRSKPYHPQAHRSWIEQKPNRARKQRNREQWEGETPAKPLDWRKRRPGTGFAGELARLTRVAFRSQIFCAHRGSWKHRRSGRSGSLVATGKVSLRR